MSVLFNRLLLVSRAIPKRTFVYQRSTRGFQTVNKFHNNNTINSIVKTYDDYYNMPPPKNSILISGILGGVYGMYWVNKNYKNSEYQYWGLSEYISKSIAPFLFSVCAVYKKSPFVE